MKLSNIYVFTLLVASSLSLLPVGIVSAYPVENLKPIGSSTFKWTFFKIYDGALYNNEGIYSGIKPGLALKLDYRRNISSERLIETTRDQWKDLALYQEEISEQWLTELSQLWPDVNKGDAITLHVEDELRADFYLNESLLGSITDAEFTRAFLAIWLAENASFPKFRNELIGLR